MTALIATTRVTVFRWSSTGQDGQGAADGRDIWGDPTDTSTTVPGAQGSNDKVAEHLPAAVTEDRQRTFELNRGRDGGVVEYLTVRFRPGTDVREGDRLVDERTGAVMHVELVSNTHGVGSRADVRTTCTKAAATSTP